jgi:hypothetical protein
VGASPPRRARRDRGLGRAGAGGVAQLATAATCDATAAYCCVLRTAYLLGTGCMLLAAAASTKGNHDLSETAVRISGVSAECKVMHCVPHQHPSMKVSATTEEDCKSMGWNFHCIGCARPWPSATSLKYHELKCRPAGAARDVAPHSNTHPHTRRTTATVTMTVTGQCVCVGEVN